MSAIFLLHFAKWFEKTWVIDLIYKMLRIFGCSYNLCLNSNYGREVADGHSSAIHAIPMDCGCRYSHHPCCLLKLKDCSYRSFSTRAHLGHFSTFRLIAYPFDIVSSSWSLKKLRSLFPCAFWVHMSIHYAMASCFRYPNQDFKHFRK